MIKARDLRPKLLRAILKEHRNLSDDEEDIALETVIDRGSIVAPKRDLGLCLKDFSARGLIDLKEVPGDAGETYYYISMTLAGIEEAEELEEIDETAFNTSAGNAGLSLDSSASVAPPPSFGSVNVNNLADSPFLGFPPAHASGNNLGIAPAAGRYVSVHDNQSSFGELSAALSKIRDEFAHDHNKRELPINNIEAVQTEIEAFELTIARGWVSSNSAKNLIETLRYIKDVCVEFEEICVASTLAIAALTTIFGFL